MALAALCCAALGANAATVDKAAFSDHVTFTVNGSGSAELTNFPMLVRLSEVELPGFSYGRANKDELAFADADDNLLPYDVDTWNESGESLVWVKVPNIPVGGTEVTMYWAANGSFTAYNTPADVWSDYAGVWHMGDGVDATAKSETGTVGSNAEVVDTGAFGSAVKATGNGAPLLTAKASADVNNLTNGTFTISFWTYLNGTADVSGLQYLFSRRANWSGEPGYVLRLATRAPVATNQSWGLACGRSDFVYSTFSGANGISGLKTDGWIRHDVVYYTNDDGSSKRFYWYINGELKKDYGLATNFGPFMNGNTDIIAIGGRVNATAESLNGAMDEFRMKAGMVDATVLAAEMSNISQKNFYGTTIADGLFLLPGAVVTNESVKVDYWLSKPVISSMWEAYGKPAVIEIGELRSGGTSRLYRCFTKDTGDFVVEFTSDDDFANLAPGDYRLYVASADSLVDEEVEFEVTVNANQIDNFNDHVTFAVKGAESTALSNFPLLVRISETELPGFSYGRADKDDLAFVDDVGNPLSYDVDTWNESGESLVWVKVPAIPVGGTKVTMFWSRKAGEPVANTSTNVWTDYLGVWHFSEEISGGSAATAVSADSTANGLDASPYDTSAGDLAQMVSTPGIIGNARVNATASVDGGNRLWAPAPAADIDPGSSFSFSGWVRVDGSPTDSNKAKKVRIISRRDSLDSADGWEIEVSGTTVTSNKQMTFYGKNGSADFAYTDVSDYRLDQLADFTYVNAAYDGSTLWVYGNNRKSDAKTAEKTIAEATTNDLEYAFGCDSGTNCNYTSLWGCYDEYRIRRGVAAATSAEFFAIADAEYSNAIQTDYRGASEEGGSFIVPGLVVTNGTAEVDYWTESPTLSRSIWVYGNISAGDIALPTGVLRSGKTARTYRVENLTAGGSDYITTTDELVALPVGSYILWCECPDSTAETAKVNFTVQDELANVYSDHVTLTLNGVGETPITNYTMLVRISEDLLPGFSYRRAEDGTKIRFADSASGCALPFDVDTWNIRGESLVWVNVPVATNGTKVVFYWALKEGQTPPDNDKANVWSSYVGVWHMNDATDATGNSAQGEFDRESVRRRDGAIGAARGRTATGIKGPIASMPASGAMDALTASGAFTVSGWIRLNSLQTEWAYLFSRKERNDTDGWGVQFDGGSDGSASKLKVYSDGRNSKGISTNGRFEAGTWAHVAVAYVNNTVQVFVNGRAIGDPTSAYSPLAGTDNLFIGGMSPSSSAEAGAGVGCTLNGDMDEVRIYAGATSTARLRAECDNVEFTDYLSAVEGTDGGFIVPGNVVTNDSIAVDYWMEMPAISPVIWEFGSDPEIKFNPGKLRSGLSTTNWCENALTGELATNEVTAASLKELPAGSYVIYYRGDNVADAAVYFSVTMDSGVGNIGGTVEGRVLLMNNDCKGSRNFKEPDINYQAWYNIDPGKPAFWEHSNDYDDTDKDNIMAGTESILWTTNHAAKLWHLVDCRHGNTFPRRNSTELSANQNYLSYSDRSLTIRQRVYVATDRSGVGQLLMRNTTDSVVYSPCYTNGIGTVYFDAVNGWNDNIEEYSGDNPNSYQLIVEMATTNKLGEAATDENCLTTEMSTDSVTGDEVVTTNYYGNLTDACWTPCTAYPVRVRGGSSLSNETETAVVSLAVSDGGTMGEFYRIYVPINVYGPVRFRIRRASIVEDNDEDTEAYILIDNIIASPPPMKADILPAGRPYDKSLRGKSVLGQECAFTKPFPAVGEDIYARAVVKFSDCPVEEWADLDTSNFVVSAKMHYRWRYLNQIVGDWKTVELNPRDGFKSLTPLDLPNEIGDVEFKFDAVLQTPHYNYVDYSGLSLEDGFSAIYSENVPAAANEANAAPGEYPTFGTDWFVRLRNSSSTNELWRLHVRKADGSPYRVDDTGASYADFELTDDGTWRCFVRTPSVITNGLLYRVEQFNPQVDDADVFAYSTNLWKGVVALTNDVRSTQLAAAASSDEWAWTYCPGTTGYLMFELDESGAYPVLSVKCADMQNFNGWNDANKQDAVFVGTSAEDGDPDKSGVSPNMKTFEERFANWEPCVATNRFWTERFVGTVVEGAVTESNQYRGYEQFDEADTPNGWKAGGGMWVFEKYRNEGMAFQMQGRGAGYMTFQNTAVAPRGIESISFTTRLSQSMTPDDIYLSDVAPWNGANKTLTNYTFVVNAAMSPVSAPSVSRWDSKFDGAGQISVFGGYRSGRGGYELRLMRIQEKRYEAALYKWNGSKAVKLTSCGGSHNYASLPITIYRDRYPMMFISVDYRPDGTCKVVAGIALGLQGAGSASDAVNGHSSLGEEVPSSCGVLKMCYWDATPPSKGWGSFGISSANCPAVFAEPRIYKSAIPFPAWADEGQTHAVAPGGAAEWGGDGANMWHNTTTPYTSTVAARAAFGFNGERISLKNLVEEDWTTENNNFIVNAEDSHKRIEAVAPTQPLIVEWAPDGSTAWQPLATNYVSGFTLSDTFTVPVYKKVNAAIRLKHGGKTIDDNCVDVTIDDVVVRQLRGDDYDNAKMYNGYTFPDKSYGSPTNFVYTSAWVNGEGSVELAPMRTSTNAVSSIRTPLMDGDVESGRGIGLGMFSFAYTNANEHAWLKLQMATNRNVGIATLAGYTKEMPGSVNWVDVTNFDFRVMSPAQRAGGVLSHYLGLHGQRGVMRLVVPEELVEAAEGSGDIAYGRVFVTGAICRDEPELGTGSWWGWNLRTGTGLVEADDKGLMLLGDYTDSSDANAGMSAALNNSIADGIIASDSETYSKHQPFIQTPTFTNGTEVGEISIKARRYDQLAGVTPRVSVFGASPVGRRQNIEDDGAWTYVTHFDVTNETYRTYKFKTKGGQSFEVLRFVVVGVDGVQKTHGKATDPAYIDLEKPVVRVALDDIVVTEALRPKMAFRNVFAFRREPNTPETDFLARSFIDGYGKMAMQPLAGENWGVQAEVYATQLPDEIDFSKGVDVTLYWYDGGYVPWGFSNWEEYAKPVKLAPCEDEPLVFRSTFADGYTASVLPERDAGTVVQYMLKLEYHTFDSDDPLTVWMGETDWTKPAWYRGIDYNNKEFKAADSFSAYCLFDSIAPGWAWINEVNVVGGLSQDYDNLDENRQYFEVAMPAEADLSDWWVDFISMDGTTNTVCRFGDGFDAPGKKSANAASNCVFMVVSSPSSRSELAKLKVDGKDVQVDGVWHFDHANGWTFGEDGALGHWFPVAARLVRPSGIIEHEIVFEGTNMYAEISEELGREYSAAALAAELNALDPDGAWKAVGDDSLYGDRSLGETGRSADETSLWLNTMKRTPGFINQYQVIDPLHPTPNGTSYIIYASIDPSVGHMTQTFGDKTNTTEMVAAVVQNGTSAEIVYHVENWYELDSVNVNGKDMDLPANRSGDIMLTLGGASTSNNLEVVASSRVNETLASIWGLTNRYTSAVVDWLNKGTTLRGPFKNPKGPLAASKFVPLSLNPAAMSPMSLTDMYWLDIDPTDIDETTGSNKWWFVAGMIKPPSPVVTTPEFNADHNAENNVEMGVYMCITNWESGERFAPYVLRGVAPGETSWAYSAGEINSWTGASFKITANLANGLPFNIGWVPLRWFVFDKNSFNPADTPEEFQSSIEVLDPYSTESPGYAHGWSKWRDKANVFFMWTLEDGRSVFSIDVLCPTNRISY